jgi:hypothetical protein
MWTFCTCVDKAADYVDVNLANSGETRDDCSEVCKLARKEREREREGDKGSYTFHYCRAAIDFNARHVAHL